MPEYHKGTDVTFPDAVPSSGFRNAIPNTKRYQKLNKKTLADVCKASFMGDYDLLEDLLASGDEMNLFNGDLNMFNGYKAMPAEFPHGKRCTPEHMNPLHFAALAGHTECVELLLQAKADPHIRELMKKGQDPNDGKTALEFAKEEGYDDIVDILSKAEKDTPYGWYVAGGPTANMKQYDCFQWETKPDQGWYLQRPGAAAKEGLDPSKYGAKAVQKFSRREARKAAGKITGGSKATSQAASQAAPTQETSEPEAAKAKQTLPVGLLFPGQGSQYVKMTTPLRDIAAVQDMFARARSILGFDIQEICIRGPEAKLEETKFCQPAMFIANLAGVEKLRLEKADVVEKFEACAGLSLGEYTALTVAGVFDFEDALKLVKTRGEAMQEAADASEQAMLSVAGLEQNVLAACCERAVAKVGPDGVCQIANVLFPKGFSCAGTQKAIMELKSIVETEGAIQAKMLKTHGGFHTPLMAPAVDKLAKALEEVLPRMRPPAKKVYMNFNGKPIEVGTPPSEIVQLLKKQLTNPVQWEPSVQAMIQDGIKEFYEVGPMKQLKAMMKRIDSKMWGSTYNVEV